MNWSNLPAHILENIFDFTASDGFHYNSNPHARLLNLEKLSRVCTHWKETIFSSNLLFNSNHSRISYSKSKHKNYEDQCEEIKLILESGLFPKVKFLILEDPNGLEILQNYATDLSLYEINVLTDTNWTKDHLKSLIQFISHCPELVSSQLCFRSFYGLEMFDQEWAILFWSWLVKSIHCGRYDKEIQLYIIHATFENRIDWSFVSTFDYTGPGAVSELDISMTKFDDISDFALQEGPDWSYLTNSIEIDQVTVACPCQTTQTLLEKMKTKSLKISSFRSLSLNWLNNFDEVHFVNQARYLVDSIRIIKHKNAHFILEYKEVLRHRIAVRHVADFMNYSGSNVLIHELVNSPVKTLTCPSPHEYRLLRLRWPKFPTTTFVCDQTLPIKWDQFLDLLRVSYVDFIFVIFLFRASIRKIFKPEDEKRKALYSTFISYVKVFHCKSTLYKINEN